MAHLVDCPGCKGTGKRNLQVTEHGKGTQMVKINCIDCNGRAKITQQEADAIRRQWAEYKALFCSCGNPSGQTTFHDDETHPQCSKHCWTCDDCGKIVQIG